MTGLIQFVPLHGSLIGVNQTKYEQRRQTQLWPGVGALSRFNGVADVQGAMHKLPKSSPRQRSVSSPDGNRASYWSSWCAPLLMD